MKPGVVSREGVFVIDGQPRLLMIGDYPYYRDDAANWEDRVQGLAAAGLDVLSFYVPWRHHAPRDPRQGATYDFHGVTQPNRDLVRLLDLAAAHRLRVILKPGPFIHAEVAYGGLPDYVDPERRGDIEAERDAHGHLLRWPSGDAPGARALPAPFDATFARYVHDWLHALARDVLATRTWPRGPVIGLQVMNEGIYSDSSRASPFQLGYSTSTLDRYRRFRRERFPAEPGESEPPRAIERLARPADLLPYLDWSAFQSVLYNEVATMYARSLYAGGLDPQLPLALNFNPNIDTYRTQPASNDGWYTRVNLGETELTFATTNWVGVVAGDPQAFRQYVMALTSFRGPCLEQNWGYSSEYYAPYEFVSPSHFESMLGLACGATGFAIYPLASTRAWRSDASLGDRSTRHRTNERDDETSGDYPGNAAILSNGERTPKYWTVAQLAHYFRSEGPRFVAHGPVAPVAWAIYGPYAWAGQWLPRGDPDDILWRPPLAAIPRGAYHGLDAFVEMMTHAGVGFRQVDVARDSPALDRTRILCISGHEYMDRATQERLAAWVERGGRLLVTNLVPDKDERLRPATGALQARVFPHEVVRRLRLSTPEALEVRGEAAGKALEFAFQIRPPADADPLARLRGACAGYVRDVGAGRALFLGAGPWRAVHSGDDAVLARANQDLTWRLLRELGIDELVPARAVDAPPGELSVWQHGDPLRDEQHLFVIAREFAGEARIRVPRPGASAVTVRLRTPSQTAHAFSLADGRLRACYLKGVNDLRGERVRPSIATPDEEWLVDEECDLVVVPDGDDHRAVSVAHLAGGKTSARLSGAGRTDALEIRRIEDGGVQRVRARAPARRASTD